MAPATPPPDAGSATVIVRAQKIVAAKVVARLIYADVIEADWAVVEDLRQDDAKLWEGQTGNHELSMPEVRADTIYVKTMQVGSLEAKRVHAKELKVDGKRKKANGGGSGNGNGSGRDNDKDENEDADGHEDEDEDEDDG